MLADCTLKLFERLKKRRFIKSENGQPYRATRLGIRSVNPQYDNR
ncbi:MAG: YjhX family toxin [Pseudomonadota bacterium]